MRLAEEADAEGTAWRAQDADLRKLWGVPTDLRPWTDMPGVRVTGPGLPDTARVRCLMDLAAIYHLGAGPRATDLVQEAKQTNCWNKIKDLMQDVYLDYSQNPIRKPWSNKQKTSKCMATSSAIYSFSDQRAVTPLEMMYWQGHPRTFQVPSGLTPKSLGRLAGEGIFLPSLGSIVWALVCSGNLPGMPGH